MTFESTQRGTRSGTLLVTDNAPSGTQSVTLSGAGTVVELNPSKLGLGAQCLAGHCYPKTLTTTLTNSGDTTLDITGITISGTGFSQTNNCPSSVASGGACTISVTFDPAAPGKFTGAVSVGDNGGGSPQQVSLSGLAKEMCPPPVCLSPDASLGASGANDVSPKPH